MIEFVLVDNGKDARKHILALWSLVKMHVVMGP